MATNTRAWTDRDTHALLAAHAEGLNWVEIACRIDRSWSAVKEHGHQLGLEANKKREQRAVQWTEERLAELRRRYEAGEPWDMIIRALRRGSVECRAQVRAMGLTPRMPAKAWTVAKLDRLVALKAAGHGWQEIAVMIGCEPHQAVGVYRRGLDQAYDVASKVKEKPLPLRPCIGVYCQKQVSFRPEHKGNFLCKRCSAACT